MYRIYRLKTIRRTTIVEKACFFLLTFLGVILGKKEKMKYKLSRIDRRCSVSTKKTIIEQCQCLIRLSSYKSCKHDRYLQKQ